MAINTRETIETTLGSLIMVLTEEAARFIRDEEWVYEVAALILKDLLSEEPLSKAWH